ncbi:MAG: hypothetical protein RL701_4508 [Pseudomonadota bacterium]
MTSVLIAGGGIGGLVTALSLADLGLRVEVYEATPALKPLGVGINLLPHAVRELYELGLQEQLEQNGVLTGELAYFNKHGQPIWREPRGLAAGYRWPQISVHRGELQLLLLAAVQARLGREHVHLGQRLVALDQGPDGVRAHFVDRTGQDAGAVAERPYTVDADFLIGADGIHSRVRAQLHPHEGPPCWNHSVMWRGVTEGEPFLSGRTMIMAGHAAQKFVCYPIKQCGERVLINWVAELRLSSRQLSEREDWNKRGDLDEFLPQFEGWHFDGIDVPSMLRAAEDVYVYPMVDREPLDSWGQGRVTLLGDAAHPMYPVGSNGASQAILDARVLTGCLRTYDGKDEIETALRAYERVRRPATAAITLSNRGHGPELCMMLAEERAPSGFKHVEEVISRAELESISAKYKRVAGFSIDELNHSPSLAQLEY